MAGTDGFSFPTLFSFLPLFAFGGRKRLRGWAEEGGGRNDYLARWVIPIPWHSHSRRLRTKERAPIPSSSPPLLPWVLPKASESGRRGKASSLMVICAAASFLFSYSPLPPMSPVMMITSNLLPSPSSSPPFFPYPASFYISLLLWMLVQRRKRGERDGGKGVEGEEIDLRDEYFSFRRRRRPRARESTGEEIHLSPFLSRHPPTHPKKILPHSCASHFRHVLEHGGGKGQKTMTKARK